MMLDHEYPCSHTSTSVGFADPSVVVNRIGLVADDGEVGPQDGVDRSLAHVVRSVDQVVDGKRRREVCRSLLADPSVQLSAQPVVVRDYEIDGVKTSGGEDVAVPSR